jgi:hypothetical protein
MSLIAYIPKIAKNRYVHVSYKNDSCAIRDFIATGDRACKDYSYSEVKDMIAHSIQGDDVSIKNISYWVKRLTEYSVKKFGALAEINNSGQFIRDRSEEASRNVRNLKTNCFSLEKPRVLFYGERGIVNTLFITLSNNENAFQDFINMVVTYEGNKLYDKKIEDYSIIIEPQFSDFGSPDAVITINEELLIIFDAKRCTFKEDEYNLSFQNELNYALAKKIISINTIPETIYVEVDCYSSDLNKQRGQKAVNIKKLNINDEHLFFFDDLVKCNKFSCLSLTRDKDKEQLSNYYKNVNGIEASNMSWIGYDSLYKLVEKYGLNWIKSHLEMSRSKLGRYI